MTDSEFENQLLYIEEMLTRSARRLTNNNDDAKDLVQETFLKSLIHRKSFKDDTASLNAWAYVIMKNTFITHYRKSLRHRTIFDFTEDAYFLSRNESSFNEEPDAALCKKEINEAIDRMESKFRVPFRMLTQGYKYREIAAILGLRIGTVKKRIFYSRKKLNKTLPGYH